MRRTGTRRRSRFWAVGTSALLLVACDGGPTDGDRLSCEDGDLALGEELGRRSVGTTCTTHADCTQVALEPHCPDDGARYSWCPWAAHTDDAAGLQSELTAVLRDLCPRIPADCRGGASCAETVPACVDGQCRSVDPIAQCIADCNACDVLSTCEGHCPARHECILAAESCDAIVRCVSGPAPDGG